MRVFVFIIAAGALFLCIQLLWFFWISAARKKGIYPRRGEATMFHVRTFLQQGQKELAVRTYCEIFKTNRMRALRDVSALERSLKS